jgi:hypothetical protein
MLWLFGTQPAAQPQLPQQAGDESPSLGGKQLVALGGAWWKDPAGAAARAGEP